MNWTMVSSRFPFHFVDADRSYFNDPEGNILSDLSALTALTDDEQSSDAAGPLELGKVNTWFEVNLPNCSVKAISLSVQQLRGTYQNLNFILVNLMSVAPKDVEVGYTLSWIKYTKKDISCGKGVNMLDDDVALMNLVSKIEKQLLAEYSRRTH